MPVPEGQIRDYSGGSVTTYLASAVNDTATSITAQDATTFPAASSSKFAAIVINRGKPNQEKIFYSPKSGNIFQNCIRGADGSQAFSHEIGETIEHCHTALDAREANAHATDTTRNDHTQYVHKTVGGTISANHNFAGNQTFSGTATFNAAVNTNANFTATTFTATTVTGNVAFSGNPVFANATFTASPTMPMATTVTTLDSTTSTVGTSPKPAREDHEHALDAKAILRLTVPAGTIIPWAGSSLPNRPHEVGEYAWPDGTAISRTTYSDYYANCGTAHGSGNGTTTVNLPDMRGRVITGVDGAHALGAKAGNLTKSLTAAENGPHTHTDSGHTHNGGGGYQYVVGDIGSSTQWFTEGASGNHGNGDITYTPSTATGTANIQSSGSGTAFSLEQPWIGLNYIVKVH